MSRVRTIQHGFDAGEWSPRLEGRSDLQKYSSALSTCENFIARKEGAVTRRPGSRYVAEVKNSADETRLLPFQFSTEQAYMIEVGDLYMRFYKDGAQIISGTPVELVTPYDDADVFDIHFAQSADVIYLAHRDYAPRKLSRTSDTSWTLTAIDFKDGPYLGDVTKIAEGTDTITLKVNGNSGSGKTMTASAALFVADHVGSIWRIKGASVWGYVKVTGYTSSTVVTVTIVSALDFGTPGTDTTTNWFEGAWSAVRGYPGVVTLFQQRLWWGSTYQQPDSFWGSVTADYENHSPGTAVSTDATNYTLASNAVNQIRWMAPARSMLIGTAGQEWQVSSSGAAIAPDDAEAKPETNYGSCAVQPVQMHNAVLFWQRSARVLREYVYDYVNDAYQAPDLTLLAEHLTRQYSVVQMTYQQDPDSMLWAVRADGQLLGMTYERSLELVAWHRHIFGGSFGSDNAVCKSVAVIPHPDGDRDQVWVIVKRTIDGSTAQYVEYLESKNGVVATPFGSGLGNLNVDSGVVGTHAGGTDTITGLDHLEGETVDLVGIPYAASGQADVQPAVYPQKVVSGGQITGIDPPVYQYEVGLHYESDLLTLRPEIPSGVGTSQAARKRYNQVVVRLHDSLGGEINGEGLSFRSPSDPMTSGPSLVTDDLIAKNLGWDRAGRIRVQQRQPLPFTVLSIVGTVNVED